VIGVLVELVCETDFVAKSEEFRQTADDIAMHVSWSDPRWVTRDEVDESAIEEEKALIAKQAESEGKPADVIPRIVEGRIEAFYQDNVLYEQKFVNPERFDGTVGDMVAALAAKMGENSSVRRVARLSVGSWVVGRVAASCPAQAERGGLRRSGGRLRHRPGDGAEGGHGDSRGHRRRDPGRHRRGRGQHLPWRVPGRQGDGPCL